MSPLKKIVEPFLKQTDAVLDEGYSAVLYGSLARGDHIPGWSDINLLLIVDHVDFDVLAALVQPVAAWVKQDAPPPLVMSRKEWGRSSDVFPIEITDMKTSYRVLRGMDPLDGLVVTKDSLRWTLERELRGTLNKLRQGYLPVGLRPEDLGRFVQESISSVVVLLRSLLALTGKESRGGARSVVDWAAALVGFNPAPLLRTLAARGPGRWSCGREEFEGYMLAVERTVTFVDELQPGDVE